MTSSTDKRWRPQFRLRSLLLFVALAAIPLAWVSTKLSRGRKEGIAFRKLQSVGAGGSSNIFGNVTYLTFPRRYSSPPKVQDEDLKELKGMSCLWRLNLDRTDTTDAGLMHLQGLTSLNTLQLSGTKVTDAGLKQLENIRSLRYLDLRQTAVTKDGVERLQKHLPQCEIDWGSE